MTNAIADLMRAVPSYYLPSELEDNFLPLWEKAMGGVVLFDTTLNEDAAQYFEPAAVNKVGYAGAGASNLTDPKRGSENTIESEHQSNGVKLVWDFTTAQANGTIQSICLTSSKGGEGEYGSNADPDYEYAGIFIDQGVSGYRGNRPEFQKMLVKARNGEIDLIVTKSISRYGRNTIVVLQTIRELRELGVSY